jgi:hypothetical protein
VCPAIVPRTQLKPLIRRQAQRRRGRRGEALHIRDAHPRAPWRVQGMPYVHYLQSRLAHAGASGPPNRRRGVIVPAPSFTHLPGAAPAVPPMHPLHVMSCMPLSCMSKSHAPRLPHLHAHEHDRVLLFLNAITVAPAPVASATAVGLRSPCRRSRPPFAVERRALLSAVG